jgi:hypothetical protein
MVDFVSSAMRFIESFTFSSAAGSSWLPSFLRLAIWPTISGLPNPLIGSIPQIPSSEQRGFFFTMTLHRISWLAPNGVLADQKLKEESQFSSSRAARYYLSLICMRD